MARVQGATTPAASMALFYKPMLGVKCGEMLKKATA
jgi:hypothetical protein